eukprot:3832905-Pyramimonas_sp.AAC.1
MQSHISRHKIGLYTMHSSARQQSQRVSWPRRRYLRSLPTLPSPLWSDANLLEPALQDRRAVRVARPSGSRQPRKEMPKMPRPLS